MKVALMRLSEAGYEIALNAMYDKGWNLTTIPTFLHQKTVSRFFNRKSVSLESFRTICTTLEIEVEEVRDQNCEVSRLAKQSMREIRRGEYPRAVAGWCRTYFVANTTTAFSLQRVFTSITFSNPAIPDVDRLLEELNGGNKKILISGKAGAGKSTLFRYLTLEYLDRQLGHIPILLNLVNLNTLPYSSCSLLEFLKRRMQVDGVSESNIETMLRAGNLLILLDGLDEVSSEKIGALLREIQDLIMNYSKNNFLISSRSFSINSVNSVFDDFTRLSINGFSPNQIKTYTDKFFEANNQIILAPKFESQLNSNSALSDLASTPLLLSLLCSAFQNGQQLCDTPYKLYHYALEGILKRWVNNPDPYVYKPLIKSLITLLSGIALSSWMESNNRIEVVTINQQLVQYDQIFGLPNHVSIDGFISTLQQYGLLRLQDIDSYAFINPIFGEYLIAIAVVSGCTSYSWEEVLEIKLFDRLWYNIWEMIIQMIPNTGLRSADDFIYLMNRRINQLLTPYQVSQQILTWIQRKTQAIQDISPCYLDACVRSTYLEVVYDYGMSNASGIALPGNLPEEMKIDFYMGGILFLAMLLANSMGRLFPKYQLDDLYFGLDRLIDRNFDQDAPFSPPKHALDRNELMDFSININIKTRKKYAQLIQQRLTLLVELVHCARLRNQLDISFRTIPCVDSNYNVADWQFWSEGFRSIMIEYRDIGHNWQICGLTEGEYEDLKRYYNANLLLVKCIRSSNVSDAVRDYILANLLLPADNVESSQN
jgi:hypothetical protein